MMDNAEESTLDVEIIDIHAWEAEETNRNKLLIRSVIANKGSPGMVNRAMRIGSSNPRQLKCHAAFIWYNLGQETAEQGETAYEDESEWMDRAIDLRQLYSRAIAENGGIGKNQMERILRTVRKQNDDHFTTKVVEDLCKEESKPLVDKLKNKGETSG